MATINGTNFYDQLPGIKNSLWFFGGINLTYIEMVYVGSYFLNINWK